MVEAFTRVGVFIKRRSIKLDKAMFICREMARDPIQQYTKAGLMRSFDEIYAISADRHGGAEALESTLSKPLPPDELAAIPDDRWLSTITRCVFQAGFNWKVIENKRDGFEAAGLIVKDTAEGAEWELSPAFDAKKLEALR